jgi:octaprenyl-diphosphate synthase
LHSLNFRPLPVAERCITHLPASSRITEIMELAKKVLEKELIIFEQRFKASVKSHVPLLDRIMQYIVRRKGKQLRPMFVLLSARLCGEITEQSYRAASFVELLHTATLVHDDVVDEANERRGFFSINALWKNKVAVLVGDYLLSKGLLLSLENEDFKTLKILSTAVRKMSEGELLQIEKSRNLNLQEDIYFEIIRNKTASLLASACAAGAWSTSENDEKTELLRQFGEDVGVAFQIKDDLFDYGSADIGKPTGNDIKEKKLTLPLIHTLNKVDSSVKRSMINTIKNHNKNSKKVKEVIQIVHDYGGISYSQQKMEEHRDRALKILYTFPENESRKALEELVRFTTDRSY